MMNSAIPFNYAAAPNVRCLVGKSDKRDRDSGDQLGSGLLDSAEQLKHRRLVEHARRDAVRQRCVEEHDRDPGRGETNRCPERLPDLVIDGRSKALAAAQ
jgi:hypothetical protein